MPANRFWTVGYRTGGTLNFRWNRTANYETRAEAETCAADCRRMGYPAHVYNAGQLDAIGLPETYEPGDPIIQYADAD